MRHESAGSGSVLQRTAFVLPGGGSLACVQVGMLRALHDGGVTPDLVVGASAGAINAVAYAADPTSDGLARLAEQWTAVARGRGLRPSWIRWLRLASGRAASLADPGPLESLLRAQLPVAVLEATRIPCLVLATDQLTGAACELTAGDAVDACLASAAVPAVFPPRQIAKRNLIDGALGSGAGLEVAVRAGATRLILLPVGYPCAIRVPPVGPLQSAMHAFSLLLARQVASEVWSVSRRHTLRIVPPLCPLEYSAADFTATSTLMARAYRQTMAWLAAGGLEHEPEAVALSLQPHVHDADGAGHPLPR